MTAPSLVWLTALAVEVAGGLKGVDVEGLTDVADAALGAGDDPADVAAVLIYEIVRGRPLASGNARLAVLAADRWLDDSGLRLRVDEPEGAAKLLGTIATGQADQAEVTMWIHAHVSACEEPAMFQRQRVIAKDIPPPAR